ncbi:hypothetical protein G9A89_014961 [Geosiphon pyriformis]|nr:hypothetical protein G9A89_014961 [Geosiphon pyriformis]
MTSFNNFTSLSVEEAFDRFKGCIYGAAIGDAIGLATEFLSKEQAKGLYGVGPIQFGREKGYPFHLDSHRSRWETGDWTDDTDQQLLIIESLLTTNGSFNSRDFAIRLFEWAEKGFPELDNKPPFGIGLTVGSVLNHPSFKTTPHRAAWDVWNSYDRNMAANGALMRTAILGVPYFWNENQVVKQTLQATKVTHADPRCCISSVIVTVLISRLLRGDLAIRDSGLDDASKQEIFRWMKSGKPGNEPTENIDFEAPPELNQPQSSKFKGNISSGIFKNLFSSSPRSNDKIWLDRMLARQNEMWKTSKKRNTPIIPDILPLSMDTFGPDPELLSLTQDVVNCYKFMLDVPLPADEATSESAGKQARFQRFQKNTGEDTLLEHCFPELISSLQLDEPSSIGYVYKCLGSALYCFNRNLKEQANEGEAFKKIITELILEAGDADTNGAVAGALLGARIGYKKLPKEWLEGLRFTEWLDQKINRLWGKVNDALINENS